MPGDDTARMLSSVTSRTADIFKQKVYIILVIWNMLINFGINYGWEYATLTNWGRIHMIDRVYLWRTVHVGKVTVAKVWLDIVITAFVIPWFTVLLATAGTRKEVLKGALEPISESLLDQFPWRAFPLRMKNNCGRAWIIAFEYFCVFGWGFVGILDAAVGTSGLGGHAYITIKSLFAAFEAFFVYTTVHVSACSMDKYVDERRAAHARGQYSVADSESGAAPFITGGPDGGVSFETSEAVPIVGNVPKDGPGSQFSLPRMAPIHGKARAPSGDMVERERGSSGSSDGAGGSGAR